MKMSDAIREVWREYDLTKERMKKFRNRLGKGFVISSPLLIIFALGLGSVFFWSEFFGRVAMFGVICILFCWLLIWIDFWTKVFEKMEDDA